MCWITIDSNSKKGEKLWGSRPKARVTFARQVINYQGCESVYETAGLSNYKLRLDDICVGSYASLEFRVTLYQSLRMLYNPEMNDKNRVIRIIKRLLGELLFPMTLCSYKNTYESFMLQVE